MQPLKHGSAWIIVYGKAGVGFDGCWTSDKGWSREAAPTCMQFPSREQAADYIAEHKTAMEQAWARDLCESGK